MELKPIKALIIDDEEYSRITLKNMLTDFCEAVQVVGMAESVRSAIEYIAKEQPDLVFLDIEMPEQSGFHLFDYFSSPDFDVVFTTAYNQYAVKAFRLSAIDYLLKPIDLDELRGAIKKVREKKELDADKKKIGVLKENLNNVLKKLALPTSDGYIFVEISDIVRCEAQGNYTNFYFKDGEKILISRTLKVYDDMLSEFNFFRINRSSLINLNHLKRYTRQRPATITITDGTILQLSESRKEEFLRRIEGIN